MRKERCKSHGYVGSKLDSSNGYESLPRPVSVHLSSLSTGASANAYAAYARHYEVITNNNPSAYSCSNLSKNDTSCYVCNVRPYNHVSKKV